MLFLNALAEELVIASNMLGDLAYDLGNDPDLLRRHMTSLQRIDYITQMQLAIVELLRKGPVDFGSISEVTLADMADRLTHATSQIDRL